MIKKKVQIGGYITAWVAVCVFESIVVIPRLFSYCTADFRPMTQIFRDTPLRVAAFKCCVNMH